jgi:hypothetical protein
VTEQLKQLIVAAEDDSENCATAYLNGKMSDEEFIKKFKESRKLYHIRNQKLERLGK